MIKVKIEGLDKTIARISGLGKQVDYAASRALNSMAFKVNAEIKTQMQARFKGGATPYTLRAFKVEKATKHNLVASVSLREDAPEGGTSYTKALRHLFTGGTRQWKKLEGWLRGRGLLPAGYMIVPGSKIALDSRGNIRRTQLNEMLGVIGSNIRNLRVAYKRHAGSSKKSKDIGFFVIMPGAKSHLHPGIWRRIEHGDYSTVVQPYIMYVKPGSWGQFINLQKIGEQIVSQHWQPEFNKEFTAAMQSAR